MSGRSNPLGKVLDHPWYIVGLIGVVALTMWVISTRTQAHSVKASFSSAFNLFSGLDVRVDGFDVGKLGQIKYNEDGTAEVDIGIDNEDYWPLPAGTLARTRYGTTIGNGTRYIELELGPDNGPTLKQDQIIPMKLTTPIVDVDQVVNVFTTKKRAEVQSLTDRLDKSFNGPELNEAVGSAGPGVNAASNFLQELGADNQALSSLITNTRKTMGNLASRSETVKDLVTVTAATFDEFAQNTDGMERALSEAPSTFREARTTLRRVDASLGGLDALMTDLAPGARQLQPLARTATPALRELRATVPSGVSTVRAVRRASPSLRQLLIKGQPFLTRLDEDSKQLAPMVDCIRPYAPETAGTIAGLAGWTQSYENNTIPQGIDKALNHPNRYDSHKLNQNGSAQVHGLRALPILSARSLSYPDGISTEAFSKLTGTYYAFPRPASLAAGRPQFREECGVGLDALNPAKDPEK